MKIHTIMCECNKPARYREAKREYVCGNTDRFATCCAFNMSETFAAKNSLSRDFDPKRDYERKPMPGYIQTGPTSYERISEPDGKAIYREGLAAVRKLVKRGEW